MTEFLYKKRFLNAFESLPNDDKDLVREAVREVRAYYETNKGSYGLRIKKLYEGVSGKVFEARLNLSIRLIWVEHKGLVAFALLGSHDEVRRYLRNL